MSDLRKGGVAIVMKEEVFVTIVIKTIEDPVLIIKKPYPVYVVDDV